MISVYCTAIGAAEAGWGYYCFRVVTLPPPWHRQQAVTPCTGQGDWTYPEELGACWVISAYPSLAEAAGVAKDYYCFKMRRCPSWHRHRWRRYGVIGGHAMRRAIPLTQKG